MVLPYTQLVHSGRNDAVLITFLFIIGFKFQDPHGSRETVDDAMLYLAHFFFFWSYFD